MQKIILASASPRRKNLLEKIGLEFQVLPSNYEEQLEDDDFSYEKIENLALNKAKDVAEKLQEGIVIAADTVVVLEGKILGKPHSKDEARLMIKSLSIRSLLTASSEARTSTRS